MRATIVLLRRPGASSLLAAGMVGRVPMGMVGLGMTLMIVDATGSYGTAGAVAAVMTLAAALATPVTGRLADRLGQRRFLPAIVTANSAALLLLACAVTNGWPVPSWWAAAALAGVSLPNLRGVTRTRWTAIARGGGDRARASAVETVADETAFLLGPMLAAALALRFGAAAAVAVAAAAGLAGGLALALQRRTEPPRAPARPAGHASGRPGAALAGPMFALGGMFGALHVATVAFAAATAPALSGLLLGAPAVGSLAAGLALSGGLLASPSRRLRLGTVLLAAGLAPLPWVGGPGPYAACLVVGGLGVAAAMSGAFGLVEHLVPRERLTEGMGVVAAALSMGSAAGSALAGRLIDSVSLSAGLLLPGGAAALAAVLCRRRAARADPFHAPPPRPSRHRVAVPGPSAPNR